MTRFKQSMRFAFFALLFSFLTAGTAAAGTITYEFSGDALIFSISFEKEYSGFNALKNDKNIIIAFETAEEFTFDRQTFFDLPIQNAELKSDDNKKTLIFTFNGPIIEPAVSKQAKSITATFPLNTPLQVAAASAPPRAPAMPGAGTYIRMFFALITIIAFILLLFGIMKIFFKHNVVSDIPGTGRLLGRVDLAMKKSLVFYELGEIIYILGITDHGINLIDKVTDPVDINVLKAGFSRRKDFSSYLKFFGKKNELKEDMDNSSALLEEKLSSLRKK